MPVRMDPLLPENAETKVPGRSLPAFLAILAFIAATSTLTGCLYTTHHFNSGRILDPGQTAVTLGFGRARVYEQGCPDGWERPLATPAAPIARDIQ